MKWAGHKGQIPSTMLRRSAFSTVSPHRGPFTPTIRNWKLTSATARPADYTSESDRSQSGPNGTLTITCASSTESTTLPVLQWVSSTRADRTPLVLPRLVRGGRSLQAPQRSLIDHYIAYRALVRARAACIRFGQGHTSSKDDARAHLRLALTRLRSSSVTVTLIGGLPGTRKAQWQHCRSRPSHWCCRATSFVRNSPAWTPRPPSCRYPKRALHTQLHHPHLLRAPSENA